MKFRSMSASPPTCNCTRRLPAHRSGSVDRRSLAGPQEIQRRGLCRHHCQAGGMPARRMLRSHNTVWYALEIAGLTSRCGDAEWEPAPPVHASRPPDQVGAVKVQRFFNLRNK